MAFHIHFRDTPHSEHLRSECEGWGAALRQEFPETSRVEVTVSHDRDVHEVHVHVTGKHVDFASSAKSRDSVLVSARDAFDKLHAQLRKHHDKQIFAHRRDKL
jgi:ribosome-associated translation inhibitor RaiA